MAFNLEWAAHLCSSAHGPEFPPTSGETEREKRVKPRIFVVAVAVVVVFFFVCLPAGPGARVFVGVSVWMDVSADRTQQHHTGVRRG